MDINLLPSRAKRRRRAPFSKGSLGRSGRKSLAIIMLSVAVVLCGGVLYAWMDQKQNALQSTVNALQSKVTAAQLASNTSNKKTVDSTPANAIEQVSTERRPMDTMMKSIATALVPGMTVDDVHVSIDGLQIDGRTENLGDLATYQANLEKLPWAKSVNVVNLQPVSGQASPSVVFSSLSKSIAVTALKNSYTLTITFASETGGGL